MNRSTWRTPPTVAELRQLSTNDPSVRAIERELEHDPATLPPAPAPAMWSEDSHPRNMSDIIGPAYSPREANALLRAATAPPASLEERVEALELELAELRGRRPTWDRITSWLRRRLAA